MKLPGMDNRYQLLFQKLSMLVNSSNTTIISQLELPTKSNKNPHYKIKLNPLEKAINEQCVIRILYQSLEENSPTERNVHPYAITIRAGEWYLVSFTPDRNDYRFYRLERIHNLHVMNQKFARDEHFDLEAMFAHSFGVYRADETEVIVRLHGKAARLADERIWHNDTEFKWNDQTTATLKTKVQGTTEILKWILSMGSEAEVLKPDEFRKEFILEIEKMLASYK
jgi:predicted DNA-binding transcriptional regulator YafY